MEIPQVTDVAKGNVRGAVRAVNSKKSPVNESISATPVALYRQSVD
jgi:hypothetical protein